MQAAPLATACASPQVRFQAAATQLCQLSHPTSNPHGRLVPGFSRVAFGLPYLVPPGPRRLACPGPQEAASTAQAPATAIMRR